MPVAPCQPLAASLGSPVTGTSNTARCLQARSQRSALQLQRLQQAAVRRLCRATAEKERQQVQQQTQPQVPDMPATPTESAQERLPAAQASSQQAESITSVEEIQQRAAMLRQQKQLTETKDGLVEGVMEEVALIKWPSPIKAVLNTFLVIAIVAGTSAVLLGINSLLTEISNAVY